MNAMRLNLLSHDEQIDKSHSRSIDPEDRSAAALSTLAMIPRKRHSELEKQRSLVKYATYFRG